MNLSEEILKSVELLKKGKVLLSPTDTIWGLSCDATSSRAVERIYKIKGRSESKSLIVLLDSVEKLSRYMKVVPPIAYDLIENSRSPLTIVYPGAKNLAKNVIASDGSIAIRIVNGEYCSEVIKKFDRPIVSTSANIAGQPAPGFFTDIDPEIITRVDHVVTVFRDRIRSLKPSTIIKLEPDGHFSVLRS